MENGRMEQICPIRFLLQTQFYCSLHCLLSNANILVYKGSSSWQQNSTHFIEKQSIPSGEDHEDYMADSVNV